MFFLFCFVSSRALWLPRRRLLGGAPPPQNVLPYLHGVGADYLPAEPLPDLDGQLGLAGAGGSKNDHQRRHHGSPHRHLHASSGRRHDAARSGWPADWRHACAARAQRRERLALLPGNRPAITVDWKRCDGGSLILSLGRCAVMLTFESFHVFLGLICFRCH